MSKGKVNSVFWGGFVEGTGLDYKNTPSCQRSIWHRSAVCSKTSTLTLQLWATALPPLVGTVLRTVLHFRNADEELSVIPQHQHGQFTSRLLYQVLGLQQGQIFCRHAVNLKQNFQKGYTTSTCIGTVSKNQLFTFKTRSPSWRLPSLAARPVGVKCLMKIWLPNFIPYSTERKPSKSWQEPLILAQCKAVVILTVCGFFLDQGCSDGFVLHILIGKSLEARHDGKVVTVAVRRRASSSSVTAGVGVALTPRLWHIIV